MSNAVHSTTALFANDASGVDECQWPEVWLALERLENIIQFCCGFDGFDVVVYAEFIDHEADLWGQLQSGKCSEEGGRFEVGMPTAMRR